MNESLLSSLQYYDEIVAGSILEETYELKGSLHVLPSFQEGSHSEIAICNLAALLPFTISEVSISMLHYAAPLALAAQHLNTGNDLLVSDLRGLPDRCNIRFTLEWFDTQFSEKVAVDEVIKVTSRAIPPCTFLGAQRSAVSMPTSIISGLRGFPQISALSTSPALNDKSQYPLFGRTVPADDDTAIPVILHYQSLGVRYLGVVYVNDAYGTQFVRGLERAAAAYAPEITIQSVDISPQKDSVENVRQAVHFLKETNYEYIFGIIFPEENFNMMMQEAYKEGIAGTGRHTWIFSDSTYGYINSRQHVNGSIMQKALQGTGAITPSGGIPELMDSSKVFMDEVDKVMNPTDVDYLISRSPHPDTYTTENILNEYRNQNRDNYGPFLYDSVVSVGMAACSAAAVNSNRGDYFNGSEHFEYIKNTSFFGASGEVRLDGETATRDPNSAYYALHNFFVEPVSPGGESGMNNVTNKLSVATTGLFSAGSWEELSPYIYADGSTNPPPDLPVIEVDRNFLGTGWRAAGLTMCGIGMALAIGFALWTRVNIKERVVMASQPIFLYLICFGMVIFMSSIIPLGFDEEVASAQGCTIACKSFLWQISIGFSVTFSAIFTKTMRVNKIFHNPRFQRILVTPLDVAKPMLLLLGANILVLLLMTTLSSLEWVEEVVQRDMFGRPTETRGFCDWSTSIAYVAPLGLINLSCLMFSMLQAYQARGISIEFAESEYILKSMLVAALACFLSFPVLLLIHEHNTAYYFFLSATICITGCVFMMLMFVPKIRYFLRQKRIGDKKLNRGFPGSFASIYNRSTDRSVLFQLPECEEEVSSESGLLVLSHPKTQKQLRKRVKELEKKVRQLTDALANSKVVTDYLYGDDKSKGSNHSGGQLWFSLDSNSTPSSEGVARRRSSSVVILGGPNSTTDDIETPRRSIVFMSGNAIDVDKQTEGLRDSIVSLPPNRSLDTATAESIRALRQALEESSESPDSEELVLEAESSDPTRPTNSSEC